VNRSDEPAPATPLALRLAEWAHDLQPSRDDLELAHRSLLDTMAVALAARDHPVTALASGLPESARWAVAGHVLDFDDLHMESTTHVSAVCVPTALATGGGAKAYLAAAGVMARLGTALGWAHYSAGWHATCTAGAPASAAGAAVALGLTTRQIATAIALAVPGAGGVQRAFGTDGKSLQVGFAVHAGIRAARLAAAGARADPSALDAWLSLVGGDPGAGQSGQADQAAPDGQEPPGGQAVPDGPELGGGQEPRGGQAVPGGPGPRGGQAVPGGPEPGGGQEPRGGQAVPAAPAVPGGLAVKLYPCCYALQRPISALAELALERGLGSSQVSRIVLRTPEAAVKPLIHHRPVTGLQAKFSLEYAAAAALLDGYPGFASFTDGAVRRPEAIRLAGLVETKLEPGGSWLLDGKLEAAVHTKTGEIERISLRFPPGSPARPPTPDQLRAKLADCVAALDTDPATWTWDTAAQVLREGLPS
jgi:2-methylcitrate dehydratase PrpD